MEACVGHRWPLHRVLSLWLSLPNLHLLCVYLCSHDSGDVTPTLSSLVDANESKISHSCEGWI